MQEIPLAEHSTMQQLLERTICPTSQEPSSIPVCVTPQKIMEGDIGRVAKVGVGLLLLLSGEVLLVAHCLLSSSQTD